ncbi:amidohydrolase family protein [Microvirga alba]|uniref:amidohydrolase family protein n=1 Tax=Microvirga alba TaxID=2791025 RepID=UPI002D21C165|nr:amidohydrolase family protein [Microvirga alba]
MPPPTSAPLRPLPPGAWDNHVHLYGPWNKFSLVPERRHIPPLATYEQYIDMLDTAGFEHGLIVHGSGSGLNHSVTLDGLRRAEGRLKGIAVIPTTTSDSELSALMEAGIVGLRFMNNGRPPSHPAVGMRDLNDFKVFAPRMRAAGLQAQVFAKCEYIVEASRDFLSYGVPIVFDHMGLFDVALGLGHATFQSFLRLLKDGDFWVKFSPSQVSKRPGDYADVRPFYDALAEAIPDRIVFGSLWPSHGNVGHLIDLFDAWTQDETIRNKVLSSNPGALFSKWASTQTRQLSI